VEPCADELLDVMELDEFDDEELDDAELLLLLLSLLLWDFPVNLSKREDILPE